MKNKMNLLHVKCGICVCVIISHTQVRRDGSTSTHKIQRCWNYKQNDVSSHFIIDCCLLAAATWPTCLPACLGANLPAAVPTCLPRCLPSCTGTLGEKINHCNVVVSLYTDHSTKTAKIMGRNKGRDAV